MASASTQTEEATASCAAVLAHHLLNAMTPVVGTLDALRDQRHRFDEEAVSICLGLAARRMALMVDTLRVLASAGVEEALVVVAGNGRGSTVSEAPIVPELSERA